MIPMCGRYNFSAEESRDIQQIIHEVQRRNIPRADEIKLGEVFPTDQAAILLAADDRLVPAVQTWGFPSPKGSGVIINARSETAHEKQMFRNSLDTRRCIVPCSGFYEWSSKKERFLFTSQNAGCIYMAGLYGIFEGEARYVILTTQANESVQDIHHRMPMIIRKKEIMNWLTDKDSARRMLHCRMPLFHKCAI
ncbi:hypothetical protein CLOSTMETH_03926 [[Clostridium] methylpentosum DSM 5476]|uniref:Abasic site processing protein n=1 Tax=[Clostridium] methylpentosum DSM 5476 TaxID=537013 RepID=C0EJ74_9FIRM|nr:hypothetical protein CLOSTMETH_03926 [[Clostridium] methylpentosum DSM 5476]MEE1491027.1 SOS response-associated peptidase [Massilioclostridium sp.]